jgi:hypothetical protein
LHFGQRETPSPFGHSPNPLALRALPQKGEIIQEGSEILLNAEFPYTI